MSVFKLELLLLGSALALVGFGAVAEPDDVVVALNCPDGNTDPNCPTRARPQKVQQDQQRAQQQKVQQAPPRVVAAQATCPADVRVPADARRPRAPSQPAQPPVVAQATRPSDNRAPSDPHRKAPQQPVAVDTATSVVPRGDRNTFDIRRKNPDPTASRPIRIASRPIGIPPAVSVR